MKKSIGEKLKIISKKLEQLKKLDFEFSLHGVGLHSFNGISIDSTGFKRIDNKFFEFRGEIVKYDPADKRQCWGHRYELNPPVDEKTLKEFEEKYHISLPIEFREFYKKMGNGGAGPDFGLFSLDMINNDSKNHPELISNEFPLTEILNPMNFEDEREFDKLSETMYFDQGQIAISHQGCGYYTIMVVSGPEKGNIWGDGRVGDAGFAPYQTNEKSRFTFLEWYEDWLDEKIDKIKNMNREVEIIEQYYECERKELGIIYVSLKLWKGLECKIKINFKYYPDRPSLRFPDEFSRFQKNQFYAFNYIRTKPNPLLEFVREVELRLKRG